MGHRKKVRKSAQTEKTFDGGGATRGAINSHRDVDSEDDFEATQDKILLDGQRRDNRATEGDLEASDEEVLALSGIDSDEEEQALSDSDMGGSDEEEEAEEGWGSSKKEYYNADEAEDESGLKAEEEEALRIQKRNLAKIDASAYVDDFEEWQDDKTTEEAAGVEELPEVSKDLSKSELIKILHTRNPEFSPFSLEFQSLIKQLDHFDALAQRRHHPQHDILLAKMKALRSYLAVLAFYFVLMSSPQAKNINIKEHEIMVSLVRCRQAWQTVEVIEIDENLSDVVAEAKAVVESSSLPETTSKPRKRKRPSKGIKEVLLAPVVESYAPDQDDELEETFRALKSIPKKRKTQIVPDLADNVADAVEAEDSAARRKTLQFYASQINNKSTRRNAAAQSGDLDIPYRERRKERELRMQAEAERRKGGTAGADLDDEETGPRENNMDSDDEYYQLIASASKKEKQDRKQDHDDAVAAVRAERAGYALPETVDGKRKIGRDIAVNKGVRVNRPKENRNARVKKRNKYDAAKKKLSSQKAIFKQPTGSYAGEASGINQRVIKSTKFD